MQYFPRLDGIRALAVVAVLLAHFFARLPLGDVDQIGRAGVRIFFVLSGFLITRILLDYRERMTIGEAARTFYWRRLLRLVPPYYFAIFVAVCLGIMNMRQDWLWHALYLSSQLFKSRWTGAHEPAGHLWSLSVEEQFYILWFLVAVWLPRRWLIPSIIGCFAISAVHRYGTHYIWGQPASDLLGSLDFLALGALLGWASINRTAVFDAFANWWAVGLSGAAMVALIVLYPIAPLLQPVMGLFGASLIALATKPEARALDWLASAPFAYIGKISYGIYLYHLFVRALFNFAGLAVQHYYLRGIILTVLTVAVAALSWELIEKPALSLKDRSLFRWRLKRGSFQLP